MLTDKSIAQCTITLITIMKNEFVCLTLTPVQKSFNALFQLWSIVLGLLDYINHLPFLIEILALLLTFLLVVIAVPVLVLITKTFLVCITESLIYTTLVVTTFLLQEAINITTLLYIDMAGFVHTLFWLSFGMWWTVTCTASFLIFISTFLNADAKEKLSRAWGE